MKVCAPISGIVSNLMAQDGARVAEGEAIMQVECMKSFFDVVAPAAGIVRYRVQLGQMVGDDETVATVEEG